MKRAKIGREWPNFKLYLFDQSHDVVNNNYFCLHKKSLSVNFNHFSVYKKVLQSWPLCCRQSLQSFGMFLARSELKGWTLHGGVNPSCKVSEFIFSPKFQKPRVNVIKIRVAWLSYWKRWCNSLTRCWNNKSCPKSSVSWAGALV